MNASQTTPDNPHTRVARAAVMAGVFSALAVGVAYAIARLAGGELVARDISMAGGLMLLAGVPGLLFAAIGAGKMRGGAAYGFLAGMAIRMPVGAALALLGAGWGLAATDWFSQCIAGAYLVLLVIEVICLGPAVKATASFAPANISSTPAFDSPGTQGSAKETV